jgi:hypothetical protein
MARRSEEFWDLFEEGLPAANATEIKACVIEDLDVFLFVHEDQIEQLTPRPVNHATLTVLTANLHCDGPELEYRCGNYETLTWHLIFS